MSCITILKGRGLKLTPQRMLIADVIHDVKGHLAATEIIERVRAKIPGVNKSTIYRTLALLEEAGAVYKSKLGEGFIYHHAEEGHHHHLVCRQCGKTIDCDEDLFLPVQRLLSKKYNFCVDFKHIVISGICEECKKQERR